MHWIWCNCRFCCIYTKYFLRKNPSGTKPKQETAPKKEDESSSINAEGADEHDEHDKNTVSTTSVGLTWAILALDFSQFSRQIKTIFSPNFQPQVYDVEYDDDEVDDEELYQRRINAVTYRWADWRFGEYFCVRQNRHLNSINYSNVSFVEFLPKLAPTSDVAEDIASKEHLYETCKAALETIRKFMIQLFEDKRQKHCRVFSIAVIFLCDVMCLGLIGKI